MYIIIPTLVLTILFFALYHYEARSLWNGLLFTAMIGSWCICLIYISLTYNLWALIIIPTIIAFILIFELTIGIIILLIFLFINGIRLVRREGFRITNLLTLIMSIGLFCYFIIGLMAPERFFTPVFIVIYSGITLLLFYFISDLYVFLCSSFLYLFQRPKLKQDYIIILGSGLIHDQVTPLLKGRIDRAIRFYYKQERAAQPPILIFSGGQGKNEGRSEASAMQEYALSKGIPKIQTILEAHSLNTYQNLIYSKVIMDEREPDPYESIFISTQYHVFRAGMYARKIGLKSKGIGSKTKTYYWTNAIIREYIAVTVSRKQTHIIVVGFILAFTLFFAGLTFFIN